MPKTRTTLYDVAEHLRTPQEMAAYLEASLEDANGDAAFVAKALGDIARAKGMAYVARDTGLSRESLYKALSGERSPDFATILKVVSALGLSLHADCNRHVAVEARARVVRERAADSPLDVRGVKRKLPAGALMAALAESRATGARFVRTLPARKRGK